MTSASSELSEENLNGDDDSFNSSWSDDGDKRHNNPLDDKVDNRTENVTTTSEGSSAQSLKEKMESLKLSSTFAKSLQKVMTGWAATLRTLKSTIIQNISKKVCRTASKHHSSVSKSVEVCAQL